MCDTCGCDSFQDHGSANFHSHLHDHAPLRQNERTGQRVVQIEQDLLAANNAAATRNRLWLEERGIVAINLISSPGSGKTTLLEKTLESLNGRVKCAVITGDQQTDHDARRLAGKGAPVQQIETFSACHLNAQQIGELLPRVASGGVQLVFIENVGNLVCPSAFDLGESFKVALLSTPEGEDKPAKYPALFSLAPVVVLTKMDLAPYLDWDRTLCRDYLRRVHPGVVIFELSAKTGEGMDRWIDYLVSLV